MKKLSYLIIILLGLFTAGCDSDDTDGLLEFYILKSDVCFTAAGGDGTIDIAAPGAFTTSSTADWCTVTSAGSQLKVSVSANPELTSRTALVKITCAGETLSVPVTQAGSILILEASELTFKAVAGRYAYPIDNNVAQWQAEVPTDNDWCTASTTGDSLILTLTLNPKGTDRVTILTITTGNVSKEITLTQKGVKIIPSLEEAVFEARGGTKKIVFTDIIPGWDATAADNWCTLNISDDTLFVSVPLYTETTDRNTTIAVQVGEVTLDIPVSQTGVQPINKMFVASTAQWHFDNTKTSGLYTVIFGMLDEDMTAIGETMADMYLTQKATDKGTHVMTFITDDGRVTFENSITYNFTADAGTDDQVTIEFTGGAIGEYCAWYFDNVEGIKYLASYLGGTFTVVADDPIAPTELTFTDSEREDYFTVVLKETE